MGLSCFKDKTGLPALPQSEDTERQLSALSRQETELTEKQSRYLTLISQLEDHKTRVFGARKDLTEALSESDIFKSTLKELHARLKECEAAAIQRKDALEEATRLSESLRDVETERQLQSDLSALQADTQHTVRELEAKKLEQDRLQQQLRETEKAVSLLEKLEVELEHQLGEEASKHEQARRKAYLRGLFLLLLRRVQVRSLNSLLRWKEMAHRRTLFGKSLLGMVWPACPDLQSLQTLCSAFPSSEVLEEARGMLLNITEETERTYESYKDQYAGNEEELREAALRSICHAKIQSLQTFRDIFSAAANQSEAIKAYQSNQRSAIAQTLTEALQGSSHAVGKLSALSSDQLDAGLRRQALCLLEAAKSEQTACLQAQAELSRLDAVLADLPLDQLSGLLSQVEKCQAAAALPLELQPKEVPSTLESSDIQLGEEAQQIGQEEITTEVSEASAPIEELLAAAPDVPESTFLPESAILPSDISSEARDSVLFSPTLKVLQLFPLSDLRILPVPELLAAFQCLLKSLSPETAVWECVLDYFVCTYGRADAAKYMTQMVGSVSALENPVYLEILLSALGLSLRHPLPSTQAYGLIAAATALEGQADDVHTGGCIPLIDAFKVAAKLFQTDPTAGQEVLAGLQPESMEAHSYLNFILCAKLKEVKKDSMQLFKAIQNNGKVTCAELVAGLQDKLQLWASAQQISAFFSHIDSSGSGSIGRVEFGKEVTFKTYMPLEKQLTTTRLRFLQVVSPLLHPPAQLNTKKLAEETQAWLMELEGQRLIVS